MRKENQKERSGKAACAGMGGSLGLAALAGACSVGCGFGAAPLFGILTSMGLGTVAAFLPTLRIPLVILALIFGAFALRTFTRRKNALGAAACGCVLGAGLAFLGWQTMRADDCKTASAIESVLKQISPQAKMVFQKGVYPLWPELGRAPTIQEIQSRVGLSSEQEVLAAFQELEKLGFRQMFFPGTQEIQWFWPFSSRDHGVDVTLAGSKTVHARCAIDALGMSSMFGRAAKVSIKSPLDGTSLELEIDGNKLVSATPGMVASDSDSCDEMLFFASKDEYERYVKKTGTKAMELRTLEQALERGVQSFGGVLKA